jgi:hypothetical protein
LVTMIQRRLIDYYVSKEFGKIKGWSFFNTVVI